MEKDNEILRRQLGTMSECIISQNEKNYELQKDILRAKSELMEKSGEKLDTHASRIEEALNDPIDQCLRFFIQKTSSDRLRQLASLLVREGDGVYSCNGTKLMLRLDSNGDRLVAKMGSTPFIRFEDMLLQLESDRNTALNRSTSPLVKKR